MCKKTLHLLLFLSGLTIVGASNAQTYLNGSIGVVELGTTGSTYDSTSLTLDSGNLITGEQTDFAGAVPNLGNLTASTTSVSGISSAPTPENIPNFFVFSSASFLSSSTTTPVNRFTFTLTSIQSTSANSFTGSGTIIDTLPGGFANTEGTFNMSFSGQPDVAGQGNYNFGLAALGVAPVPEPTTISLFATGLLGAWVMHRRKKIAR